MLLQWLLCFASVVDSADPIMVHATDSDFRGHVNTELQAATSLKPHNVTL